MVLPSRRNAHFRIWGHLRAILGILGISWAIFGHLGAILGLSWVILGLSWAILGLSWVTLWASWGDLGLAWAILGPPWGHLATILGHLGVLAGRSWALEVVLSPRRNVHFHIFKLCLFILGAHTRQQSPYLARFPFPC